MCVCIVNVFHFVYMFHVVMIFLEVNVAYGKNAKQSSWDGYPARNAVDGNKHSDLIGGSCTHTERRKGSWWEVDLGDVYEIQRVVITNRGDCCCKLHNTPYRRIIATISVNIKHTLCM